VLKGQTVKRVIFNTASAKFVAGFNAQHQVVTMTADIEKAKKFATEAAATKFLDMKADCGFGLCGSDCRIDVLN
jgi:hypothetical protein